MPSRAPVPASVMIFQPTFSCRRLAVSARMPRSCGLSTPVCLALRLFWNSLIAATMRSLTSPVIAPLYCPTQARSDCSTSRSACAMAFAVSAGVCRAGRIRTVVTGFGLSPAVEGSVICASAPSPAQAPNATTNKVAESTVLMTNPKGRLTGIRVGILGSLQVRPIMHICLVGNNRTPVQGNQPHPEEARSAVSKDGRHRDWG